MKTDNDIIESPDAYRLVYQGGHHNVWCDGERHIRSSGGWCWPDVKLADAFVRHPSFPCDCTRWAPRED